DPPAPGPHSGCSGTPSLSGRGYPPASGGCAGFRGWPGPFYRPDKVCCPSYLSPQAQIAVVAARADPALHYRLADGTARLFVMPAVQPKAAAAGKGAHLGEEQRQVVSIHVPQAELAHAGGVHDRA